mgnify:FL=1
MDLLVLVTLSAMLLTGLGCVIAASIEGDDND